MQTSNQKLVAAVKMNNKDVHYLNLYITKDGKDYRVSVYRGDVRDFILANDERREIARILADRSISLSLEDAADDISYGFLTDGDLYTDYAESFDLCEDDLINIGV